MHLNSQDLLSFVLDSPLKETRKSSYQLLISPQLKQYLMRSIWFENYALQCTFTVKQKASSIFISLKYRSKQTAEFTNKNPLKDQIL